MFLPWVSVLTILPILEGANGESVTQPDARVTVSQGEPVLLKCSYDYDTSYASPTLWWYEQHPNEAPRLLLAQYEASDEEERRSRRGFSATPDKQGKSFHLKKNSSELSDSAVYYCGMSDTVIAPSRVAAQKPAGGRGGGTKGTTLIYSIYDNTPIPTLWWYEQYPNEAPRLLLTQYEASDEEARRNRRGFSAAPDKQESFHLKKNSSELCKLQSTTVA